MIDAIILTTWTSAWLAAQVAASPLTLEDAERLLAGRASGTSSVGPISLAGFEFYRELDLGNRFKVLAISGNPNSGLLLFGADNKLVATQLTGAPTWLTVFDIDGDGAPEIITEETTERGTGILRRAFCIYRVGPSTIDKLWTGESYYRASTWSEREQRFFSEERRSFIRLENDEVRYLAWDRAPRETLLEMRAGKLEDAKPRGRAREK